MDVTRHMGLADRAAWRVYRKLKGYHEYEELQSEAYLGLVKLLPSYRPDRGPLGAWLNVRLYYYLLDWAREQSWAPRLAIQRARDGGPALRRQVSLDCRYFTADAGADDAGTDLHAILGTESKGLEAVEQADQIQAALRRLQPQQRQVLTLNYLARLNLKQVGRLLHRSESRISQIRTGALAQLREEYGVDPDTNDDPARPAEETTLSRSHKTALIRAKVRELGPGARPRDVVEALVRDGVAVSYQTVRTYQINEFGREETAAAAPAAQVTGVAQALAVLLPLYRDLARLVDRAGGGQAGVKVLREILELLENETPKETP